MCVHLTGCIVKRNAINAYTSRKMKVYYQPTCAIYFIYSYFHRVSKIMVKPLYLDIALVNQGIILVLLKD